MQRNISLALFLTQGHIPMVQNMFRLFDETDWCSFHSVFLYALDKETVDAFTFKSGTNTKLVLHPVGRLSLSTSATSGTSAFRDITIHKTKMLSEMTARSRDYDILFIDTDIVPQKPMLDFLRSFSPDADIVAQKWFKDAVNTGFVLIRNTDAASRHVRAWHATYKSMREQPSWTFGSLSDQQAFHKTPKKDVNIQVLSERLFPNGKFYFAPNFSKQDAYMFHNNWIVGTDAKIKRMKRLGLWNPVWKPQAC